MGTAKVVSSSYVALQLDDGVLVPQVSPSVLVRLVSVGDRVRILGGPFRGKVGWVKVSSSHAVALSLDSGEFISHILRSKVALAEDSG